MCGKGLNYIPLMSINITFMPGMFLTRFWNRWISVLIKNCCSWSRVLSAHGQLWQTSPPKNTQTCLGAEVLLSFPVYLQFIEPLDPRCEVKLVDIACKWRLPVLENRRVPSKDQEKERSFCNSEKPGKPEAWRGPTASRAPSAPPEHGTWRGGGSVTPQPVTEPGLSWHPNPLTRSKSREQEGWDTVSECHCLPLRTLHCASKIDNGTTKSITVWNWRPVLHCKPPQNHGIIKAEKAL